MVICSVKTEDTGRVSSGSISGGRFHVSLLTGQLVTRKRTSFAVGESCGGLAQGRKHANGAGRIP